ITFSKENKLHLLFLLSAVSIIIGLTCCFAKLIDKRVQRREFEFSNFEFEPLSEQKIAKAAESYRAQERTIELGQKGLDNLEKIKLKNSDTSPSHHLMSCIIQKSMSTVMSAIFCFLVREKEFVDAGRSILREYPDIRLCEGKNEFKSVQDMQTKLYLSKHHLAKWRFSMVTREPVDRFLSGFIDRCIRQVFSRIYASSVAS
ncbi:hypothetical protein GCK32_015627, partial [Trichostrongylus colubriformis]